MKSISYLFFAVIFMFGKTVVAETIQIPQNYVCPMHAEVTSKKKDSCPKCGMDLELVSNSQYQCPMHLEVVGSKHDTCPKCGMFLENLKVKTTSNSNQHH